VQPLNEHPIVAWMIRLLPSLGGRHSGISYAMVMLWNLVRRDVSGNPNRDRTGIIYRTRTTRCVSGQIIGSGISGKKISGLFCGHHSSMSATIHSVVTSLPCPELCESWTRGVGAVSSAGSKCAIVMLLAATLIAGFATIGGAEESEDPGSVTIASGRVGGLYHPVGGIICKLAAESLAEQGLSCTVDISGGSIPNIKDLRKRNVDLALVQSDLQQDALAGTGPFEDEGPFENLRSMFALYVEHFTVVARDDRDIDTFEDLKGKRVYVGGTASSRRDAMDVLADAHGWTGEEVIAVSEFEAANLAEALCDGEFDAFVYTIGHPNPMVREATALCDARLVNVSGPIIEKLNRENPFYVGSVIPGGTYKSIRRDVRTLGVVATLVTSAKVPEDVIYRITKAYFENLELLQALSPLFLSLTREEMVEAGLAAPIHEGALKYFSEVGLK